jgi:23S rRNA (guanosine2251-2'-O)-methyltransferase
MSKDNKTGGPPADDKSAKDTHYATLRRAHRDNKRERGEIPTPGFQKRKRGGDDWKPPALAPDQVYLYGLHTVRAALENKERKKIKLSVTQNALARLEVDPKLSAFRSRWSRRRISTRCSAPTPSTRA